MGNKSVLAGVAFGTLVLIVCSLRFPGRWRRTVGLALGGTLVVALVAVAIGRLIEGAQLALLQERLGDPTSLEQRFGVWENVVAYLIATAESVPSSDSARTSQSVQLRSLSFAGSSSGLGVQQEAVDSGYLYTALNYGVPALVVAMSLDGYHYVATFQANRRGGRYPGGSAPD